MGGGFEEVGDLGEEDVGVRRGGVGDLEVTGDRGGGGEGVGDCGREGVVFAVGVDLAPIGGVDLFEAVL